MNNIEQLSGIILKLHGAEAKHEHTARVREVFQGQIVWNGHVEVFRLKDHPKAQECYAWTYRDDDGKEHHTAVLKLPPVTSPETAVRAAIVAQVRNDDKKA